MFSELRQSTSRFREATLISKEDIDAFKQLLESHDVYNEVTSELVQDMYFFEQNKILRRQIPDH